MAGFTPFTENYSDLSDESGYQFEFRCDICGSAIGASSALQPGHGEHAAERREQHARRGLRRRLERGRSAKDIADRGARDEALKKAANEIMPLFTRCPRTSHWVDETCWNEARGLCVTARPSWPARWRRRGRRSRSSRCSRPCSTETVSAATRATRTTVCTNCGKPVGSEKFCSNCGTPTGLAKCTNCGNDLAPGTRFCGNCGSKVA